MHLLVIALLLLAASHGSCYYSKCCKTEEYLVEQNSAYRCVKKELHRLFVLANESDFLKDNLEGECVDVSTDFFVFIVRGGEIKEKRHVREKVFPKCCPLNYSYNSILHACETSDWDSEFVEGSLVKVGLPSCKIIVDHELNETDEIKFLSNYSREPYCIDKNERGSFVYRECKDTLDVCENVRCIKKCCPDGQSFINGSKCFDTYTHGLNLSTSTDIENPEEPYAVISNRRCPSIFILEKKKYKFHLDDNGEFHLWLNKTKSFTPYDVNDMNSYCIEHTKMPSYEKYLFFMCFPKQLPFTKKFEVTLWAKVVSCICLVLTVLVYVLLHETRNIFGKLLVNYCVALFVNDALLIYVQTSLFPTSTDCSLRAFGLIFFISAVFCWSNVICCDIYRTFGSIKQSGHAGDTVKKLLLYHLYGWGAPTIMTLIIFLFYKYPVLPHSIQPYLGTRKCFFDRLDGNYAQSLFLSLPHLIIQIINIVFFIKTTMYCVKVKNEINRVKDTLSNDRNKRFQKDKERLFLILKLSVIMGMSFVFEVVSSFFVMGELGVVAQYIEIVWDFVNSMPGVFIFIIFICKRKIYNDLIRKLGISSHKNSSFSSISTQLTPSSRSSKKSNLDITINAPNA